LKHDLETGMEAGGPIGIHLNRNVGRQLTAVIEGRA
jgi:hypothetical protein